MNRRSVLLLVVTGMWLSLAATSTLAAVESGPCSATSENRQMDFWLGDWTVTYPGMPGSSLSKVTLDLDQCLVVESWEGANQHSGKNMLAYSSDDKSWHSMFTDNRGRVHIFEGKVVAGTAEFTGPSLGPDGRTVLNRIKVTRVAANKVEQSWEKSADNGTTWKTEFRGQYSRKNP
jgi:hypothetical protein